MHERHLPLPKAVLFDLDGLIADTEPLHQRAFQVLMGRRGIELPPDIMGSLIGYDQVTNIDDLKRIYCLPEAAAELLVERAQAYEELVLSEPITPLPGFWEVDDAARRLGLRRAVVTSSTQRQVHVVLTRLFETAERPSGYDGYFDEIVNGDEVAETKPAPDLYVLATDRLGFDPAECLALEDTPAGVTAAVAAGVPCLAVPSQYARVDEFTGQLAILGSLYEVLPYVTNGRTSGDC